MNKKENAKNNCLSRWRKQNSRRDMSIDNMNMSEKNMNMKSNIVSRWGRQKSRRGVRAKKNNTGSMHLRMEIFIFKTVNVKLSLSLHSTYTYVQVQGVKSQSSCWYCMIHMPTDLPHSFERHSHSPCRNDIERGTIHEAQSSSPTYFKYCTEALYRVKVVSVCNLVLQFTRKRWSICIYLHTHTHIDQELRVGVRIMVGRELGLGSKFACKVIGLARNWGLVWLFLLAALISSAHNLCTCTAHKAKVS